MNRKRVKQQGIVHLCYDINGHKNIVCWQNKVLKFSFFGNNTYKHYKLNKIEVILRVSD